jgi:hypothetical protein
MHEAVARRTRARADDIDADAELVACIMLSQRAARASMACGDACLASDHVASLNRCLRLSLESADRCFEVAALPPRRADSDRFVLERVLAACALACERCAAECKRHGTRIEAARLCSDACEENAAACRAALAGLAAAPAAIH